jgi:DNA polymerase-3 subunit epsilon/ATP-dependent DNA helicase DinG
VTDALLRLVKALTKLQKKQPIPGLPMLIASIGSAAQVLEDSRAHLHTFTVEPDPNQIDWLALGQGAESVTVHAAPLHIGPMMEQYLWHEKDSVILTSATLRTHEDFSYIQGRLHADFVHTLNVGSPFNYRDSTLIYTPDDIPEPNQRKPYQSAVERCIIELAARLDGRVMVLFTSYTQLRQTAQAIGPRLALGNITVYDQSDGTSRESLLEGFKSTEKAVLLGTRSFWQGVDIPGESLSALVITRLPFAVPSDPVFSARADTFDNAFEEYNLPDAILRFRQGFGRLIRRQTDRGVVAVLDARLTTKGYGPHFLAALPDCTIKSGPLDDLPQIAKDWIDR